MSTGLDWSRDSPAWDSRHAQPGRSWLAWPGRRRCGDNVVLKNGTSTEGRSTATTRIVWVFDGLKRVVLRDSKIARIESDASFRNLEAFKLEQPLVVHGGAMPKEVFRVEAEPWNDKGRRIVHISRVAVEQADRMEQAINELGPYLVKIRGVDGFWQGQLATARSPARSSSAILAKVERTTRTSGSASPGS